MAGTVALFRRIWWMAGLLLIGQALHAEDPALRQAAVQLLEKANAVSTIAVHPNLEQTVTFRSFDLAESGEGQFHRTWAGKDGHRDDTRFGTYYLLNIWLPDQLIVKGEGPQTPGVVLRMKKSIPIRLVMFDHEDIIRSITDAGIGGRPASCIDFDTVFGGKTQANQICVDKQLGVLLRFRDGSDTYENSEFFAFAGAYLPGRIDISHNGQPLLEVHQKFTPIEGAIDPAIFEPPAGAEIRSKCKESRRAFGVTMPQPPAGNNGTETIDVKLHGFVGRDGRVINPYVVESDRPDLNAEAVKLVSTWTYTPGLCDGRPNVQQFTFVVHFQGR